MNQIFTFFAILLFALPQLSKAGVPDGSFEELLVTVESNPQIQLEARELAGLIDQPVEIYTIGGVYIIALGVQNGKVVFGVIRDLANPYHNSSLAFYEDIVSQFDLTDARIHYADGTVTNPLLGYDLTSSEGTGDTVVLVVESSNDVVLALDINTGNVVDPQFIGPDAVNLTLPQHAVLSPRGTITVSDQTKDLVLEYDTAGNYIRIFAPSGGVNTSIFDNTRGHYYLYNDNLLGTVGSGPNSTAIPQFDTGGVYLGNWTSTGVNNTWFILGRSADILIGSINSPYSINRYDSTGALLGLFGSVPNFPQQIAEMSSGEIAICNFSPAASSGIQIFPPGGGSYTRILNGVTSNRGVWELRNGNFLTTNAGGIHEIDGATGSLVRTIVAGVQGRMMSIYSKDFLVNIGNPNQVEFTPNEYRLFDNYPNPFNPVTNISFQLPHGNNVTLKVFNALGREVATLVNGFIQAGTHSITFDATEFSSGVYYYTLTAGDFTSSKKMILLK